MAVKKQRQLNYELLRIVAMLMIVCLHYLSKGGLLGDPARADMTATGYTAWLVEAFCLVAVNVYVLITGYFGIDSSGESKAKSPGYFGIDSAGDLSTEGIQCQGAQITFREALKRPAQIWKQVFFYSMAIGCAALLMGIQKFDIYQFFSYCFPIVTEHYWFAASYVFLCLMMPFLNAGFFLLGQKQIRYLLAGLLLFFCIAKTVIPMQLPRDRFGYDDVWFVVLYLTGAYLRRYGSIRIKNRRRAAVLYLGSVAAIFAVFCVLRVIFIRTGRLGGMITYAYTYNHLFCYTGAVGLFLAFAQAKTDSVIERFRKPIELFAGASFGVYLIHEHINIRYAWPEWFHCGQQAERPIGMFLLHMAGTVLAVYIVCTLIEIIRKEFVKRILCR